MLVDFLMVFTSARSWNWKLLFDGSELNSANHVIKVLFEIL